MHFKMLSAKLWPFRLNLSMFIGVLEDVMDKFEGGIVLLEKFLNLRDS